LPAKQVALYQKLSQKVTQLRLLGLPYKEIAKKLGVSKGTIENARRHYGKRSDEATEDEMSEEVPSPPGRSQSQKELNLSGNILI